MAYNYKGTSTKAYTRELKRAGKSWRRFLPEFMTDSLGRFRYYGGNAKVRGVERYEDRVWGQRERSRLAAKQSGFLFVLLAVAAGVVFLFTRKSARDIVLP